MAYAKIFKGSKGYPPPPPQEYIDCSHDYFTSTRSQGRTHFAYDHLFTSLNVETSHGHQNSFLIAVNDFFNIKNSFSNNNTAFSIIINSFSNIIK